MIKLFLALVSVLLAGQVQMLGAVTSAVTPITPTALATPASGNLILNPSLETASATDATLPQSWLKGNWGSNTTKFTYPAAAEAGTRGAQIDVTKYTSGDAKWYFQDVAVTVGTKYSFSDYYQSTVPTELVAQVTSTSGSYSYIDMGSVAASSSWKQATATVTAPAKAKSMTVFHLIQSVGRLQVDNFSFTPPTTSTPPPPPPAPLSVAVSSPPSGATVSGTTTVTAAASDGNPITGVQFKLDGTNLGAEDTTAPYSVPWDTTKAANGSHTLTAVARDAASTVTSANDAVTVSNAVTVPPPPPPPSSMIPNGSVETVSPTNPTQPQDWTNGGWGTNNATFSYLNTGHSGGRSLNTTITSYTSGDAKWYFTPQAVVPGQAYSFSDYYQSTIASDVVAEITMTDGTVTYQDLGTAPASTAWAQFSTRFTAPPAAKTLTIFHLIAGVGSLTTDDYSLSAYTPVPFNRGIVSLTFDDGWQSEYTNALPLLKQYNMPATFYLISTYTGAPDYMTAAQIKGLQAAGEELGDHTATHPDLTTLDQADLTYELSGSQQQLQTAFGGSFQDFASPYGAYNDNVIANIKLYYASHRSVDVGFNSRDNFNPYDILVQNIDINTTQAQIDSWVATAAQQKSWLVLVYHEVGSDFGGGVYHTDVSQLQGDLTSIKNSGLPVETVQQALTELEPQVGSGN